MPQEANSDEGRAAKARGGPWRRPFRFALFGGCLLSLLVFGLARNQEKNRARLDFLRAVDHHRAALHQGLVHYFDLLNGLSGIFIYSEDVTRDEFHRASKEALQRYPGVRALEWVGRVPASARTVSEAEARRQGVDGFQFTERDASGALVRAGDREEYWPILYVEPLAGNEAAVGYDLTTGPTRKALSLAWETKEIVGSDAIQLVQDASSRLGWILICPVQKPVRSAEPSDAPGRQGSGWVQGVFVLPEMLSAIWSGLPTGGAELQLLDLTPGATNRELFVYSARTNLLGSTALVAKDPGSVEGGFHHEVDVREAGRDWRLVCWSEPGWLDHQRTLNPYGFLAGGLVCTGLLAAYLRAIGRRGQMVEMLVREKTLELEVANVGLATEAARRLSAQQRLTLAVEAARMGTWEYDVRTKEVQWSDILKVIFGVPQATSVPSYAEFLERVHADDRETVRRTLSKALADRGDYRTKFRILWPEGSVHWIAGAGQVCCDEKGEPVRMVGVARDITNEMALEEQVRMSQKLEAVGLLAGGVAHDFNNLLQVINGCAHLAMEESIPEADRRENLKEVLDAVERAARLTRQLLAFSRRQALQKVDLNLNQLVGDLLSMIRRLIGENIEVDLVPGHELGNVKADKGQIEQVVLNLCVNARDAMPNGGRLTIESQNVYINGNYRLSHPWSKPGRYVLLSVTDTGCGMDQPTLSRIFEPFFTTKEKEKGTGLGLSVVYGIVKQHDGMIHVYSEPQLGTTFKMYLPISERSASAVGSLLVAAPGRGSETILLAEDEPSVRALATRVLERAGYKVISAVDGVEAVEKFTSSAERIALVLTDVLMPRMGGREAYDRIAAMRPGVPVLFASGYSANALQPGYSVPEGMQMIQKPYSPDELLRKIQELLKSQASLEADSRPPA